MTVPSARLLWLVAGGGFPLAVIAGVWTPARPAAWALAALALGAALLDVWLSRRRLQDLRVQASPPARNFPGRAGELPLECESPREIERLRIGIAWPDTLASPMEEQTVAMPAARLRIDWPFTPLRRGDSRLDALHLECSSRLGLWDLRRSVPLNAVIRVFPTLEHAEDLLALRRETSGVRAQRQIGQGREFEKLRDYLPGDSFDGIHWKATARRGRPVTKVFQVERTREIYAVIDGSRLPGRPAANGARLDRYVSASLVLAAAAERNGDLFGLVTFQDRVLDFVRAGKGAAHRNHCREALARLHERALAPDFDEVAIQLRLRLRRRAWLLFLTDLDDPATAESFTAAARFLSCQHLVAAATIRPATAQPLFSGMPDSLDAIYEQLSGHLGWRALKELEVRLRQQGIRFGVFEDDALSRQVAGLYHEIKMRQLI